MTTAMITGATAGIGLEFAHQLAERGVSMVLVARDLGRLESTATAIRDRYGVNVEVLSADLSDRADLARVEERISAAQHPIDLLVNNAGFGLKQPFVTNSADEETQMLEILVTAVLRLSHAAITAMRARPQLETEPANLPRGIINVSSVAAFLPRGSYSAAKAWVNSFSQWAHLEYAKDGVTVMALCPGFTRTEFHARMGVGRDSVPSFLWIDASTLVSQGLEDYAKRKAISVPTKRYKALVGLTKAVPTSLLRRVQSLGRR